MDKNIIVVLGMHRSGTSAIAKSIVDLGAYPGDNLIPGDEENEKGYWEDADIVALNDAILKMFNMKWYSIDNPMLNRFETFLPLYESRFFQDALKIINKHLEVSETILIKDPRISLLLPFWRKVFEIIGAKVKYVLVIRNPLETAQSLLKRNNININDGLKLWAFYNFMALLNVDKDILLCSFSSMLENPLEEINRISKYLNISVEESSIHEYKDRFLDKRLKHHNEDNESLIELLGTNHIITILYQTIFRMSESDVVSVEIVREFVDETLESLVQTLGFMTKEHTNDYAQIFIDSGDGFSEERSRVYKNELGRNELDLQVDGLSVEQLRFDPSCYQCMVKINRLIFENSHQQDQIDLVSQQLKGNYYRFYNGLYIFKNDDPQISIELVDRKATRIYIDFTLYLMDDYTHFALTSMEINKIESLLQLAEEEQAKTLEKLLLTERLLKKEKESKKLELLKLSNELETTKAKLENIGYEIIQIVKEKDEQIIQLNQSLLHSQEELSELFKEKGELSLLLSDKLREIEELKQLIESQIMEISHKDAEIKQICLEKEQLVHQIHEEKELSRKEIEHLEHQIAEKNEQLLNGVKLLEQHKLENIELLRELEELEKKITEINHQFTREREHLEMLVTERNEYINTIFNTLSWRITKPLRFIGRMMRRVKMSIRKLIKKTAKGIYYYTPLPIKFKIKLKNQFYRRMRFIMKNTEMYKIWEASIRHNVASSNNNVENANNQPSVIINVNNADQSTDLSIGYDYILETHDSKSIHYKEMTESFYDFHENDIKLIAFYLPQFHPVKENDEWWGKGFTEWTNVSKALPQYKGHYQPHFPGELGFYDLRVPEVMSRQVELAKMYGIHGFCFYYYWFNGRRILEKPLDQFVQSTSDFPFCLCWANENWTRRWDGEESEVLLEQNYEEESLEKFIVDLKPYISDRRYIRVENKPLLIIYRPSLIPNIKNVVEKWRAYCKAEGIGDIYLLGVYVKSWGFSNYKEYGFDGMVEFPPHSSYESGASLINDNVELLNKQFNGLIFDYEEYVNMKKYSSNNVKGLHRGIIPSWDNTARRGANATIYHGSTPALYKKWLFDLIEYTKKSFPKDKQIVFINAWNEWAEGAHLEPDRKYGYAYLEATREALVETNLQKNKKIIYVTHDTHFNGAQLLSLNIISVLNKHFGYDVEIISKAEGVLSEEFKQYGNVFIISENSRKNFENHIKKLVDQKYEIAICNTVITGDIAEILSNHDVKVVSLIHELPGVIKQYQAEGLASSIVLYADKIVFPSQYVFKKFQTVVADVPQDKVIIQPQGLYKTNSFKDSLVEAKNKLRENLNIPSNAKIVLGVGFADFRKGIDIFTDIATQVRKEDPNIYFVWVGSLEPNAMNSISRSSKESVIFIDATPDVGLYYAGADLYLLTSREDPFPSVVMEAFDVETPVIGFDDAGGFSDIVTEETGQLVEYLNKSEMIKAIKRHLYSEELLKKKGIEARSLIEKKYNFLDYVYKLLEILGHEYKKVSVVLPNYNYAHYLEDRINSIINQTYPVYELVYLDDQSKDHSQQVFSEMIPQIEEKYIKLHQLINEENSGSVFKQWMKGINHASGDYIWIAEADDLSSPYFLEEVMKPMLLDPDVVLSYSQSKQMDQEGNILANDYLEYTKDIDPTRWKRPYIMDGDQEISEALSVKNTIPNVSGVVFRKIDTAEIENEIIQFKIAGDWFFYVWLLQKGKVAFSPRSLNFHRRHTNSVTTSEKNTLHYQEVVDMQDYIIARFEVAEDLKLKVYEYREFLKRYLGLSDR